MPRGEPREPFEEAGERIAAISFANGRVLAVDCVPTLMEDGCPPGDPGDVIVLFAIGKKRMTLNLCWWSLEELDHVKEIIDMAFRAARPVVAARDAFAIEESNRGNTKNAIVRRVYRAAPRMVVWKRVESSDGEGVSE